MSGLKKLVEHRDAILLAEIGALIHDMGKLSEEFVKAHTVEESGNWIHHTAWLDYEAEKGDKDAKKLKEVLKKTRIRISGEELSFYDFVVGHHERNWGKQKNYTKPENFTFSYPNYSGNLIKFILAADKWDSSEDRGSAKDKQSICATFKSNAFGFEEELNLEILEEERKKVYKKLIEVLDTCNVNKIVEKRKELYKTIREAFSKALGMTARAANDVTLWDHSYMAATIMKCLVANHIIDENFIIESTGAKDIKKEMREKKPFKVFAIGWNFFEFIKQSHKIPDIIGRVKVINEIKEEIKEMIEEKYALGNTIYEDDFGVYFLIPGAISDLEDIEREIFKVFNEKTNGILLPVFHIQAPNTGKFSIGKLLTSAIEKIKKKLEKNEFELLEEPKWVKKWREKVNLPKGKLICNVCGKGFYYEGDKEKICETCKEIRGKGREVELPQTVFVDEIAWNPDKSDYENVCLLVARFDLKEWLNGKYVRSLFVRAPHLKKIQWLKDFYNSKLCKSDFELDEDLIKDLLSLGALKGYISSKSERAKTNAKQEIKYRLEEYNKLDSFSKKLLDKYKVKENLERCKRLLNEENIAGLQEVFSELNREEVIKRLKSEISNIEEDVLNKDDDKVKRREQHIIKEYDLKEILVRISQKMPSPSRLMRIWNNTKGFFDVIEKEICSRTYTVEECIIKVEDFKATASLPKNKPYIIEISGEEGEVISSCDQPKELVVITPHLSDLLNKNKNKYRGIEITLEDTDTKEVVAKASIKEIEEKRKRVVKAFRIISKSPNLFMALIPAGKSVEIAKVIYEKYVEHFGKVFGKLPLHIGLIYFKRKMPMFAVIDTARRMLDEFEETGDITFSVASEPDANLNHILLTLVKKDSRIKYPIKIPYKLGDGSTDSYHPYIKVENSDVDTIEIIAGTILQKHVTAVKRGDVIKFKKYCFDFEFLDSNIRRFEVGKRRKHWLFTESGPKPYLLWDIDNFERLRKIIQKTNLTNSQVMNLHEMLVSKVEEWGIKDVNTLRNDKDFKKLVKSAITNVPLRLSIGEETGKGKISKEDYDFLIESILSGLFFDFVDLWHTILKLDFGGGKNGGF